MCQRNQTAPFCSITCSFPKNSSILELTFKVLKLCILSNSSGSSSVDSITMRKNLSAFFSNIVPQEFQMLLMFISCLKLQHKRVLLHLVFDSHKYFEECCDRTKFLQTKCFDRFPTSAL